MRAAKRSEPRHQLLYFLSTILIYCIERATERRARHSLPSFSCSLNTDYIAATTLPSLDYSLSNTSASPAQTFTRLLLTIATFLLTTSLIVVNFKLRQEQRRKNSQVINLSKGFCLLVQGTLGWRMQTSRKKSMQQEARPERSSFSNLCFSLTGSVKDI